MKRACRARCPNHAPMAPGSPNRPVRNKAPTLHDQSRTKMSRRWTLWDVVDGLSRHPHRLLNAPRYPGSLQNQMA